jgi:hypothetical protein
MLNIADVVGQYPGMAAFMNANATDVVPVELNRAVVEVLNDAGFTRRGTNAVMSALFFYVTGMNMGGPAVASSSALGGANLKQLFEDGLDILLAGARARLKEDRKALAAKRLAATSRPRRGSTS